MKLQMGTRGSALALAQSGWVARRLREAVAELEIETVVIKTSGDLFGSLSPQKAAALVSGTKGLFVKEIEEALQRGAIDFAVHSAKDLPADLAPGLRIAAYPQREDPRDAFLGRPGLTWKGLAAGHKVGTSSLRRKVQLLGVKKNVSVLPLRGNVDTRLSRLEEGVFDGVIVAAAGLRRLGRAEVPHELIPIEEMLPAPAQGALAIEASSSRAEIGAVLATLDHAQTRLEVELERSFLKSFGGGCSTPLGALARARSGSSAELTVFWAREDGGGAARLTAVCGDAAGRDAFAAALAARLRSTIS